MWPDMNLLMVSSASAGSPRPPIKIFTPLSAALCRGFALLFLAGVFIVKYGDFSAISGEKMSIRREKYLFPTDVQLIIC